MKIPGNLKKAITSIKQSPFLLLLLFLDFEAVRIFSKDNANNFYR